MPLSRAWWVILASEAPVCIVGAGPVGLCLAARLASFGISTVVLEANPDLLPEGSKACLIQGDALEVLDKFGCAEQVQAEGVTWHIGNTYVRGRLVRREVHDEPIGFGPFINISQYRIEQVLLSFLRTSPLCDLRFSHRALQARQDADRVIIEGESSGGTFSLRARYLVACDGVRSGLRDLFGVTLAGQTHKDIFLITDIMAELPLSKERHFHLDPPFNRGRQVVIHPQPDNIWRIDIQLPPEFEIAGRQMEPGVPIPAAVHERLRLVLGDVPYDVQWWSTYRFHQRLAGRFSVGRVFFAGDAAHALPPYGARGMNSGIQDADNLAWKLALVLRGQASQDLLDSYSAERRAAAQENLAVTARTISFMVPPSTSRQLARKLILSMAGGVGLAKSRVNSGRMAEPFVYRSSSIVHRPEGQDLPGRLAPDGWLHVDEGPKKRLRRYLGQSFTMIAFVRYADEATVAELDVAVARLPVSVLVVTMSEQVDFRIRSRFRLAQATEQLREKYSVTNPCWLLVRPDGHVAASFPGLPDQRKIVTMLALCGKFLGPSATALTSCTKEVGR